jgi:transcriptional regulator with XRE-family HTH domain
LRVVFSADDEDAEDRRRMGAALAQLRDRAGMSQEQAALAAGYQAKQSWQQLESGRGKGIFRPALQRKLAGALGRTVEEWLMLAANLEQRAPTPTGALAERLPPSGAGRASDIVPIRGRVQANVWIPIDDLADAAPRPSNMTRDAKYGRADQYLRPCFGESMNLAGLLDGDFAHIAATAELNYWPLDDHLVEVERQRHGEDGIERERQIRAVKVTPEGVQLLARSTNPRWKEPMLAADGPPQPDGKPRIIGLVLATVRKLA